MPTTEETQAVSTAITDHIKPFVAIAAALISLGIGWAELTARIDRKAELVQVEALARRVESDAKAAVVESRVNRILLCRLDQIRPDSYCEGFR